MNNVLDIVGISALVSIVMSFVFDIVKHKNTLRFDKLFIMKNERYRSILAFMSILVNVENYKHIESYKPLPIESYKPLPNEKHAEIKAYYKEALILNGKYCILFANEKVLTALSEFIDNPTEENYKRTATEMRYDLWRKRYTN